MGRAVEVSQKRNRKKSKPVKTTASNEGGHKGDAAAAVSRDEIDKWNQQITNELQKQMNQSTSSKEEPVITIPRVPQRLRYDTDEAHYDPRIISIGPYHKDRDNLKPMEKHKWQYLKAILDRNKQVELKGYVSEIKALEVRARNCYTGDISPEGQSAFVQTMLLDGCFIVEYLLRKNEGKESNLGGMIWVEDLLFHDLLLLENQLPLFVVQKIFQLAIEKGKAPESLGQVAINMPNSPQEPFHHLLHFYHRFFMSNSVNASQKFKLDWIKALLSCFDGPSSSNQKETAETSSPTNNEECVNMIPNAMVLKKAGIKFKKREVEGGSILDVKFKDGVMEIPRLLIDDFTKTQFRNLIAFEQFYPADTEAKFTTYIKFLDNIVNTSEDVALLHRNGIIEHMFGSNEEVAHLFNVLFKGIFCHRDNYLSGLYMDVDKYRRSRRHHWWASFVHKYLNSPLKITSMGAAVILLLLTFLQTFFSIYSYFKPA